MSASDSRSDPAVVQMDKWLRVFVLGSWSQRRALRKQLRRQYDVRRIALGGYPGGERG